MHLTRSDAIKALPIPRKGTKYVARASSHLHDSVPVVIAVRDMLKLARTANEVKKMIQQKILKINGRSVKDYRESILLFNIFEADKTYELSILPTKKFFFKESGKKESRLCKVVGKSIVRKGLTQINLHDGSNILTKDKINVGDSVYLDFNGKIKKHITLDKDKEAFVFSGKYAGQQIKITDVEGNKIKVKMKGDTAELEESCMAVV